jgi:hypothetical protein
MKILKFLEKLFESKIKSFQNLTMPGGSEHLQGLIEGYELALNDIREEIKNIKEKKRL